MNIVSIEIKNHKQRAFISENIATAVDSELLLYFREQRVFTSLNSSASLLWKTMERYINSNRILTEGEIYNALSAAFHDLTVEKATEAMLSFCDQLASAGVLKWESSHEE